MCELSLAPSVPQVSLRMRPAVWVRDSGNAPGWSGHAGARPKGRRAAYNQLPVLANACRPAHFSAAQARAQYPSSVSSARSGSARARLSSQAADHEDCSYEIQGINLMLRAG
jgi:hypothetical protein